LEPTAYGLAVGFGAGRPDRQDLRGRRDRRGGADIVGFGED
jgi:hypothetical protein